MFPVQALALLVSMTLPLPSESQLFGNLDPDYGRNAPQLIISRGFSYELHHVLTSDGFYLGMHRIINPRYPEKRSAILMIHGALASAVQYLNSDVGGNINEPVTVIGSNIGFELAKRGHDVWLMEQRGNRFSSNNTSYLPNQRGYWQWSLDNIALIDIPASIDYIREYTGRDQIGIVGQSQSSTAILMMLSKLPVYNDILKPCVIIAPAFFYTADSLWMRSPILRALPYADFERILKGLDSDFTAPYLQTVIKTTCQLDFFGLCSLIAFPFLSAAYFLLQPIPPSLNMRRFPVYISSTYEFSLSDWQLGQYIQFVRTNTPAMMEFTSEINLQLYGSISAPTYDPADITCPYLVFFSAVNDPAAAPLDVDQLRQKLNVKLFYDHVVTDPAFGHLSFVYAEPAKLIPYINVPLVALFQLLYPA